MMSELKYASGEPVMVGDIVVHKNYIYPSWDKGKKVVTEIYGEMSIRLVTIKGKRPLGISNPGSYILVRRAESKEA